MSEWSAIGHIATILGRYAPAVYRLLRPMSETEKAQRRVRWRAECEQHLQLIRPGYYGRIVIRDIRRLDVYPERGPIQGVSAWYRAEMIGFYYRGVEIILSALGRLAVPDVATGGQQRWQWLPPDEDSPQKVPAVTIGRIPFEWIETIDWNGDEYFQDPHFYCRFVGPWWGPCESIIYKASFPAGSDHLLELEGLREPEPGPWGRMKLWFPEQPAP